jgi:hypothetical protein
LCPASTIQCHAIGSVRCSRVYTDSILNFDYLCLCNAESAAEARHAQAVAAAVEQCEAAECRVIALTAELSALQHQLAAAKRAHDTDVHTAERTAGKTQSSELLYSNNSTLRTLAVLYDCKHIHGISGSSSDSKIDSSISISGSVCSVFVV